MRMNKTLSYEHRARQKQVEEKDVDDKFKVIDLLYKQFGLVGLTKDTISIPDHPRNRSRFPDIHIPQKNIVIELDGEIHGNGDELTKLERDKDRDNDYREAGYKIIILNKELTFGYKEEHVIMKLEKEGLKKIAL